MSVSPGQNSSTKLAGALGRRKRAPSRGAPSFDSGPRHGPRSDPAIADAERRTLLGALELVADRRPGVLVPEVLYNDLSADVPLVMRRFLLALLSSNNLVGAMGICTAVVRLMTMQPGRRWLEARLVMRIALMAHEAAAEDLALVSSVRELVAAQSRWCAAVTRHGVLVDAGNSEDWQLVQELTSLPLDFSPMLRSLIARSIIRQDVLGVRRHITAYSRQHRESAVASRRLLDQHAPTLSSLFGAELTPTRPMARPVATRPTTRLPSRVWAPRQRAPGPQLETYKPKTCMRAVNRQPWFPREGPVETATQINSNHTSRSLQTANATHSDTHHYRDTKRLRFITF